MSRIFWDTNVDIYLLEESPQFAPAARALYLRMIAQQDELITSTMTLGEVQVLALRNADWSYAEVLRSSITAMSTVVSFNNAAADRYAQIRANYAMRPPDAIQLACAAAAGVDSFITNDSRLQRLSIQGIGSMQPLSPI